MSVSDLSGTRWLVNTTWDNSAFSTDGVFSIYFHCPDAQKASATYYQNCKGVNVNTSGQITLKDIGGVQTSFTSFISYEMYRLWYIWGGEDSTNQDLIDWLELNAVQQDLTEEYITNTYDLTQVANAVRNITKSYIGLSYPSAMASALNNMGDFWTIEQLMSTSSLGSLYYNGSRTTIPEGAFAYKKITTASFPNCGSIGSSAFQGCKSLTTISFPECSIIRTNAFMSCTNIISANLPKVKIVGESAFAYCSNLSIASFPNCTTLDVSVFQSCKSLVTIYFPECTEIGSNAFYSCTALSEVNFPKCSLIYNNAFRYDSFISIDFPECITIYDYAFYYCRELITASFPKCTTINTNAFGYCSSLTTASFPKCTTINTNAFNYCVNLISFNLTGVSIVPSLNNSNAFFSTPIAGYSTSAGQYGSIYVPASLYDAFKSATNWTYFSSRMVSV